LRSDTKIPKHYVGTVLDDYAESEVADRPIQDLYAARSADDKARAVPSARPIDRIAVKVKRYVIGANHNGADVAD
jgi:hypothetical protein